MISSVQNSRIKRIIKLRDKSRERAAENAFIIEGLKLFEEAPAEKIKEIYIEESLAKSQDFQKLSEKLKACLQNGASQETVTEQVFSKISDTMTPRGILCVMEGFSYDKNQVIQKSLERKEKENRSPLFLLLEDIQDPGNLGTMLRTAEGAGADAVFMTSLTADIYNPKTIRATMGSLFRVPFFRLESLKETISLLQSKGIAVYAAHLEGERFYQEINYSGGSAFLIGNEGKGLKEETARLADCYLKIPMEGKLESLNAAVAAALLMYQSRITT